MSDQRHKVHHVIGWVALLSAFSHVFCCGIPMVMAILGVLAGLGTFSTLLPGYNALHDLLAQYEIALVAFSLAILCLGWGLQLHASHVDCHDTGCHHEPCNPKKARARKLLWLATAIFVMNTGMVFFLHDHSGGIGHDPVMVTESP